MFFGTPIARCIANVYCLAFFARALNQQERYLIMITKHTLIFLAGAGCGAAAALLLAPASGAELRNAFAGKVAEGQRAVTDRVNDAVGGVRGAVNRRVEVVDHTIKEGVAAFNEAREVFLTA